MSRTIHGSSYKALRHMRNPASTVAVLWVYVARANSEGVAWPSVAGLSRDTGWGKTSVSDARKWLVDHKALERAEGYIRPTWRNKTAQELTRCQNFDKAEYYRATGYVEIDGTRYDILYAPSGEESDLPDDLPAEGSDVTPERISEINGYQSSADIRPGGDELDLKELELDSTEAELASKESKASSAALAADLPKPLTPQQRMFEAVCRAWGYNLAALTDTRSTEIGRVAKELVKTNATPEDMAAFKAWLDHKAESEGWKSHTVFLMSKYWPDYDAEHNAPPPAPEVWDYGDMTLQDLQDESVATFRAKLATPGAFDDRLTPEERDAQERAA